MSAHAPAAIPAAAHYVDAEARRRTVLVAVLNNGEDFERAAVEGWYRIPQRRAPQRIGADYLAFYQTGAFARLDKDSREKGSREKASREHAAEAHTVTFFAATRRYQLLTRRELLPAEQDHPRGGEYYYRVEIGPLQRLAHPVPATTYRRVTFIHTTLDRLCSAGDVRDLFRHDDPYEQLWGALREHGLRPLRNRLVGERPIDLTLRARGGYLGINCVEEVAAQEGRLPLPALQPLAGLPERWALIHLPVAQIQQDLPGCLRRIGSALLELGGSMLQEHGTGVPAALNYPIGPIG